MATNVKKKVPKDGSKKAVVKKVLNKMSKLKPQKSLPKKFEKAVSNAEVYQLIAQATGLAKKEVSSVFESLSEIVEGHVKKTGPGVCKLFGLLKIEVKVKPATKARKGRNPFTGEEIVFKAKPARKVIKIRPLKKLKEMAEK